MKGPNNETWYVATRGPCLSFFLIDTRTWTMLLEIPQGFFYYIFCDNEMKIWIGNLIM